VILYKYLQPTCIDVLEQKLIRFTQPGDFNDPFEFRPYIHTAASGDEVRSHVEANFDQLVDGSDLLEESWETRTPEALIFYGLPGKCGRSRC
jgi:hypothetical protein